MKKEATVIMAKCQKSKQAFGIRTEKISRDWHFTWAFTIDEKAAKREGYDSTTVKGSIVVDGEYPGCPHCRSTGFCQCAKCQKIGCYGGEKTYTCPFCGNTGDVEYAESFDNIKGGAF